MSYGCSGVELRLREVVMVFLHDLRAKALWCYGSTGWRTLLKTLCTDGTMAMFWYRLMQWAHYRRLGPLAMIFNKLNAICCQCIIGRGAEFGPGFVLIHSQGVVINGTVRGGRRVFVEHQVTIGAEKNRMPLLGDDVFIGAGAKIIGGVKIGSHVKVGANAVVVHDVPDGATVGGIPAKVLRQRELSSASPDMAKAEGSEDLPLTESVPHTARELVSRTD